MERVFAGAHPRSSASHYRWIVLILLLAAAFRLYGLNNLSPPGLAHDEVANWLIDRSILDEGNHTVYYPEAYGHEAGFHYWQALFIALLGDHALALRLPAAFMGLLGVAVSFALLRRLFGVQVALIAAAWLAILFWPVFFSRQALRAMMLPVVSGLSAVFWWRGWERTLSVNRDPSSVNRRVAVAAKRKATSRFTFHVSRFTDYGLAGLFAGLSLYTYTAARVLPIFYLLFAGYLLLMHWPAFRRHWRGILLFAAVFVLVSLPLLVYLLNNPEAEFRVEEVNAPLEALRAGNLRPVLANALRILGAVGVQGDPLWRHNVAGRPIFTPLLALFFYGGLALSLWRFADSRYAFLVLWLFTSWLPSLLTIDAPSTIRMSNSLVILTAFPAIVIHILKKLSTVFPSLSTIERQNVALTAVFLLFALDVASTAWGIFRVWPSNDEVEFVWQEALTEVAGILDRQPESSAVAIGGWTPESMDPPTMALSLKRDDLALRYFDPTHTLAIPATASGEPVRIFRPAALPLQQQLEARLLAGGASLVQHEEAASYTLSGQPDLQPQFSDEVAFGGELLFLGYDLPTPCTGPSDFCDVITYWRVLARPDSPRSLFLHLLNEQGKLVAQADGLDAPAAFWQPGDLLLYHHAVTLADEEPVTARLGVYCPPDGPRLMTVEGDEFVLLPGVVGE